MIYTQDTLQEMARRMQAEAGDLILILSGDDAMKTRKQLSELRLEMGRQMGLRDPKRFSCLWVIDFPMYEWSDEEQRLMAMPIRSPAPNPKTYPCSTPTSPQGFHVDEMDEGATFSKRRK